jgi:transposase
MTINDSIKLLNLEYAKEHIERIEFEEIHYKQYINVYLKRELKYCTNYDDQSGELCGSININNFGYYTRQVFHHSNTIKRQNLTVHIPRYLCKTCGKTFSGKNSIDFMNSNLTKGTFLYIMEELKEPTTTFNRLSVTTGLSNTKITTIFDKYFRPIRMKLPTVLCIDEFYKGRYFSKKFAAVLTDWENNKVIDIIDSRWTRDLENYFEMIPIYERSNVEYLTCDFYPAYRDIAYRYFPNVRVVVDLFHLKQILNKTFKIRINQVLFMEVKKCTNEELQLLEDTSLSHISDNNKGYNYKFLKKFQRELFISNNKHKMFQLRNWKGIKTQMSHQDIIDRLLGLDPRLKGMYLIIQEFYDVLDQYAIHVAKKVYPGRKFSDEEAALITCDQQFVFKQQWDEASNELDIIFNKMATFETDIFIKHVKTFREWKPEIINSMIRDSRYNGRRFTNSNAESNNAIIKQILTNVKSIRNFDRFAKRAIYVINDGTPIKDKPDDLNKQSRCKGINSGKKYTIIKH